jgi:hypothetical protein
MRVTFIDGVSTDLRYHVRMLRRNPRFMAIAILARSGAERAMLLQGD